jgi:hypothetical protein
MRAMTCSHLIAIVRFKIENRANQRIGPLERLFGMKWDGFREPSVYTHTEYTDNRNLTASAWRHSKKSHSF